MTSQRLPEYRPAHRGDDINSAIATGAVASVFEEIARLAATICEVPIAAVTLPDPDSSCLHSDLGLSAEEWTAAEAAFCLLVAGDHQAVQVVDAANDPRITQNPFIFGTLEIRFYANTPILLPMGHCIGTLSVAACEPQRLTHVQRTALDSLAHIVSTCLLNPTAGALADAAFAKGFNLNTSPEPKADLVVLASSSGEIGYVNDASVRYMDGSSPRLAGVNLLDTVTDEDRAPVAAALRDVVTRRSGATLVARMATINEVERWVR